MNWIIFSIYDKSKEHSSFIDKHINTFPPSSCKYGDNEMSNNVFDFVVFKTINLK